MTGTWRGASVDDALKALLKQLQQEFPDAELTEVGLELRLGERHDGRPSEGWADSTWLVQVGNESASAASPEEAVAELRRRLERAALRPERAERVAAALRELSDDVGEEYIVLHAAQSLLEQERRARRRAP